VSLYFKVFLSKSLTKNIFSWGSNLVPPKILVTIHIRSATDSGAISHDSV
jgi:hypothetical protein